MLTLNKNIAVCIFLLLNSPFLSICKHLAQTNKKLGKLTQVALFISSVLGVNIENKLFRMAIDTADTTDT